MKEEKIYVFHTVNGPSEKYSFYNATRSDGARFNLRHLPNSPKSLADYIITGLGDDFDVRIVNQVPPGLEEGIRLANDEKGLGVFGGPASAPRALTTKEFDGLARAIWKLSSKYHKEKSR
jgi:hypothetical protein